MTTIQSEPVQIFQTQEIHCGFDTAESLTIVEQAKYFKNLGYDFGEYWPQPLDLYKIKLPITSSGVNFDEDNKESTTEIIRTIKNILNDNGLKMIPALFNTMSHCNDVIQFYPEYSAVPPIKKLCLLSVNSCDSDKIVSSNFKITISNHLALGDSNNLFIYILWDASEPSVNYPQWLNTNFTLTETGNINFTVINTNGNIEKKYKLFRSKKELCPNQAIDLLGFSNTDPRMMYLVMAARSRYDAVKDTSLGDLFPDTSRIHFSVSGSADSTRYKWKKLDYSGGITYPYMNEPKWQVKKKNNRDTLVNISGIPPFIAHMNNALQKGVFRKPDATIYGSTDYDELGCITRPVNYNCQARGNILTNDNTRQFFNYYLDCIYDAYQIGDNGTIEAPDIIEIGHDEMGYSNQCLIYPSTGTRAQFVAEDIMEIIDIIDSKFVNEPKPLIKINGDCLTPWDYGTTYGLCGDSISGAGGVLQKLKQYAFSDRIIVASWMYDMVDGQYEPARNVTHNKWKVINYLNNLGYKFITYGGEEGALLENVNGYNRVFQCDFEWLRAGQNFSQNWFGYEHGVWQKWDTTANQTTFGQLAAISSYAIKYPYLVKSYAPHTKPSFYLRNFSGIDFKKVRDSLSWDENVNYTKPLVVEHIGVSNDTTITANFLNNYSDYKLQGNSSDYTVKDNPLFAFAESELNQKLTVKITSDNTVKKGIMLRDNLNENCNSIYYYCQNGVTRIEMRTNGSTSVSYPTLLFTPPVSNTVFFKVENRLNRIDFFFSTDGQTFKLLLTVPRSQMASTYLIGVANSNSTNAIGMNYQIKWDKNDI